VPQRLQRLEYIRKLQDEISVTEPDEAEIAELHEWEVEKEIRRVKAQKAEEEIQAAKDEASKKMLPTSLQEKEDEDEEILAILNRNKEEVRLYLFAPHTIKLCY